MLSDGCRNKKVTLIKKTIRAALEGSGASFLVAYIYIYILFILRSSGEINIYIYIIHYNILSVWKIKPSKPTPAVCCFKVM